MEREELMHSNREGKRMKMFGGLGEEKMLKSNQQPKSGSKVKPGRPVRGVAGGVGSVGESEAAQTHRNPPEDKQRSSSSLVSMPMNPA